MVLSLTLDEIWEPVLPLREANQPARLRTVVQPRLKSILATIAGQRKQQQQQDCLAPNNSRNFSSVTVTEVTLSFSTGSCGENPTTRTAVRAPLGGGGSFYYIIASSVVLDEPSPDVKKKQKLEPPNCEYVEVERDRRACGNAPSRAR